MEITYKRHRLGNFFIREIENLPSNCPSWPSLLNVEQFPSTSSSLSLFAPIYISLSLSFPLSMDVYFLLPTDIGESHFGRFQTLHTDSPCMKLWWRYRANACMGALYRQIYLRRLFQSNQISPLQ